MGKRECRDNYYLAEEYTSPQGNHITIYRPILTEEEREKRMKKIHDAACRLVLAREKA